MKRCFLMIAFCSGLLLLANGCLTANPMRAQTPRQTYTVTIIDKDTVSVGGQAMPADQLPEYLMAKGVNPEDAIIVQGDPLTPTRDIRRLTQLLNQANFRNTAFSSRPRN